MNYEHFILYGVTGIWKIHKKTYYQAHQDKNENIS